jgi:hypothetical protein
MRAAADRPLRARDGSLSNLARPSSVSCEARASRARNQDGTMQIQIKPLALTGLAAALAAPATAQDVVFSIDWWSATIAQPDSFSGTGITGGDILTPVGGQPQLGPLATPGTTISHDPTGLGLAPGCVGSPPGVPCAVEVDALSYGLDPALPSNQPIAPGRLLFSVDEHALGLLALAATPNVLSESPVGDSSADAMANVGALPPGPLAPFAVIPRNAGVIDGDGLLSGSGYSYPGLGLLEPNMPLLPPMIDGDNLDALDTDVPAGFPAGGVYFSLEGCNYDIYTGMNGSCAAAAHLVQPGDVLHCASPGGPPVVFAPSYLLGLDLTGALDDLDALILAENGSGAFEPSQQPYDWASGATDMLLFSVRRGSSVIGAPDSRFGIPIEEGDILTTPLAQTFGGVSPFPAIFIAAENLGLVTVRSGSSAIGVADELDALDVRGGPLSDCNANGIEDAIEIANNTSLDANNNGVLDTCEGPLLVNSYCYCASGAPCGNNYALAGCRNSTGLGGLLAASGTSNWSLDNLVLNMTQLPPNQFGILFMGPVQIAPVPFGDGLRCVGGQLRRYGVIQANGFGNASFGPGIVNYSQSNFPPAGWILVSSTWSFQHWYRDPGGPCGTNYNATNALAVTFY